MPDSESIIALFYYIRLLLRYPKSKTDTKGSEIFRCLESLSETTEVLLFIFWYG